MVLGSFILTYPVFYFSPWSSGEIEYIGEIVRGQNQIKNGIVFFLFIAMMVLICIQITQRRELKKMPHLNEKCIREQTEQYRLLSNRDREAAEVPPRLQRSYYRIAESGRERLKRRTGAVYRRTIHGTKQV